MRRQLIIINQIAASFAAAILLLGAVLEFHNITWGTGTWLGEYSMKWGVAFVFFLIFCIFCMLTLELALWRTSVISTSLKLMVVLRGKIGQFRWLAALPVLLLPIWFLQYSSWGVVFGKPFMRILIWSLAIICLALFITNDKTRVFTWSGILTAAVLSSAAFSLALGLKDVTNFPFSLGWSEGNRMWDYSLLFGRDIYNYLPDNPPAAYLDFGRQLSGGLPFLFGQVTIAQERLWLGMMMVFPYVVLGWISFRLPGSGSKFIPFLAGLWAWMFMNQGPIHAPLLWCAVLVALAWDRPLRLAFPLVMISAFFAQFSRYTWVFAPAMWAGMLELSSISPEQFRLSLRSCWRAIAVILAGLVGGLVVPNLLGIWNWIRNGVTSISLGGVNVTNLSTKIADQPLLWYRLLPNATYGNGILLGSLIAILPVIVILLYLHRSGKWVLNHWQKVAVILPLLAFLVVGLIISTKIGGGGDLHNMDMFLIGMMFTGALAWRAGGAEWFGAVEVFPQWLRIVVLLAILMLGYTPLMSLRPISFAEDAGWIAKLADVKMPLVPPSLRSEELIKELGSLPSDDMTQSTMKMVREYVQNAKVQGDVLFMDQRQLLTFGYVQDVDLVGEYEKKRMMDEALSDNAAYFELFYRDLAAHRFSLIISDPLRAPIKDSDYQFGEENNAWVKWVSKPVLCFYQPVETVKYIGVQLLISADNVTDCSKVLP